MGCIHLRPDPAQAPRGTAGPRWRRGVPRFRRQRVRNRADPAGGRRDLDGRNAGAAEEEVSGQSQAGKTAHHLGLIACGILVCRLTTGAADWPRLGGPDASWISPETELARKWPAQGPPVLWS